MKKRRMLLIFFTVLAIASAATGVLAQDTKPEPCSEATLVGPPAELKVNEIGDYSVIVDLKGIYQEVLFEWSTTGGNILEGQRMSNAKIKRTSDEFSVSVRIRGRRPRCEHVHRFPRV